VGAITFIHAADLHIDSPFSGLKHIPSTWMERIRNSPFQAFQKIVDTAIQLRVDFILLSGDLFDGENRSLRTQVKVRDEMNRLHDVQIPVYIIHGNHDHLNGSWVHVDFPENVHIFSTKPEVKRWVKHDGTSVHLYGFSYEKRHVTEKMIDGYEKTEGADYHIGLLHGNLEGNKAHSPYAPFTLQDLQTKHFDYWALGHIHKRQLVSEEPLAIYPGNIQGRNRKESGEKGCYVIELNQTSHQFTFIETAEILWETVEVSIEESYSFDDVLSSCKKVIADKQQHHRDYLLEITLDIPAAAEQSLLTASFLDDVLELLQEDAEFADSTSWPYRIRVRENVTRFDKNKETPFTAELNKQSAAFTTYNEAIAPLYNHAGARKYLDTLSEEDLKELLEEAKWLVLQSLSF
jgi:exonuclease SbcD